MKKNNNTKKAVVLVMALLFLSCSWQAVAHPISLSKARVDIEKDVVRVSIDISCEDFFLYHDLEPDDQNRLKPDDLSVAIEKHQLFLLKYVSMLDKDGRRLKGRMAQVRPFIIPPEGLSIDQMTRHNTTYEMEYSLVSPPEFITFVQDLGGQESFLPAIMEVEIWREGVEIDHVSQLEKGQAHILRFDWANPPVPLTASLRQRREQERRQQEATMGISSYGSIYSFLYLEPFEVRHEILIPLLTLEMFCPVKRADKNFLEIEEQDAAKETIERFLSQRNTVRMDGIEVTPTVSRIDFYGLDFKDFAMMAPPRRLSAMNARVGIILSYSPKGSLGKLTVDWDMFTSQTTVVRSTIFTDDKTEKFVFSRYRRQFKWDNPDHERLPALEAIACPPPIPPLSIAWLSIICLVIALPVCVFLKNPSKRIVKLSAVLLLTGVMLLSWSSVRLEVRNPFVPEPEMSDEQADVLFAALHKNIYRATDYRQESDIYDALAHSVGGQLLPRLYLLVHQGRLMAEQGGAVSRIREIQILDGQKQRVFRNEDNRTVFTYQARWTVRGTVEHWGHIHERTNEYEARFEIEAQSEAWRIIHFDVFQEKRLQYKTRLRKI